MFSLNVIFYFITSLIYLSSISTVYSELVQHQLCPNTPTHKCKIESIRIDPCPEALQNETCVFYKDTDIVWTFSVQPDFSAQNLTIQAYSYVFGIFDVPYPGQDRNGCNYTTCPINAGDKIIVKYTTPILISYPSGAYTSKWRIWNEKEEECCLMVPALIQ